jgi:hypothetical protein
MPNYCENDLYVRGPSAVIAELMALIGADAAMPQFNFSAVIPYPERMAQMDKEATAFGFSRSALTQEEKTAARDAYIAKYGNDRDGFNSGGYEWCVDNWGTKWGASDVVRRDYGGVCLTFQTAWAPPKPVILALATRFPKLTFSLEYFERGMGFCGGFTCPAEDEFEGDENETWQPGIARDEWHSSEYLGMRGG